MGSIFKRSKCFHLGLWTQDFHQRVVWHVGEGGGGVEEGGVQVDLEAASGGFVSIEFQTFLSLQVTR